MSMLQRIVVPCNLLTITLGSKLTMSQWHLVPIDLSWENFNKKYLSKKIYKEVTEFIFDMNNVRIFKEIEKKKMGDVYTLLYLWSAELSKTFG